MTITSQKRFRCRNNILPITGLPLHRIDLVYRTYTSTISVDLITQFTYTNQRADS